jgi:hypothetical protein
LSKTIAGIPERSIRKPMVKRSFAGLIYQYYTFSKVAPTKSSTAPRAHTLRIIRWMTIFTLLKSSSNLLTLFPNFLSSALYHSHLKGTLYTKISTEIPSVFWQHIITRNFSTNRRARLGLW